MKLSRIKGLIQIGHIPDPARKSLELKSLDPVLYPLTSRVSAFRPNRHNKVTPYREAHVHTRSLHRDRLPYDTEAVLL